MKKMDQKRRFYQSLEAKSLRSRTLSHWVADFLTTLSSTPFFLFINIIFFTVWIGINLGYFNFVLPFDPYPFGLLTMIVSLEAIFLSIFVLVSQQRASQIDTIREEVHLRINLIAEEEITKILEILADMRKVVGVHKNDPELEEMLQRINTPYIERLIAEQIEKANKPAFRRLMREFPQVFTKFGYQAVPPEMPKKPATPLSTAKK